MTPPRIHAARAKQIAAGVRSGGYPAVAAEAFGVTAEQFEAWLRARSKSTRAVHAAHAQARLRAEIALFEKQPGTWLEHGPGRERDGYPGWTASVKPNHQETRGRSALLDPEVLRCVGELLPLFTDDPLRRVAISNVFHGHAA